MTEVANRVDQGIDADRNIGVADDNDVDDTDDYSDSSDDEWDSKLLAPLKRMVTCRNCTRTLRKHPFCATLFGRFAFFLAATGLIQVTLFCTLLFDPRLGVQNQYELLPVFADCGVTEKKFKPTQTVFVLLIILNATQMILNLCSIAVTFLFVRKMQFRTVVIQYFLLALVIICTKITCSMPMHFDSQF